MSLSADAAIRIIEGRYDYLSARTVFNEAVTAAGLEAKGPFDAAAAKKLANALKQVGDRVDAVAAELVEAAADKKPVAKEEAGDDDGKAGAKGRAPAKK